MGWRYSLIKTLIAVLAALALIAFAFPAQQVVERSLVIEHSPDRIWELLEDPPAWNRWSPWYERDPDMRVTYTGAPKGMGARWHWESNTEGSGRVSVISASVARQLDYIVQFEWFSMALGQILGQFILEPVNSGTNLTWRLQLDAGMNPVLRWLGLFLNTVAGDDLDKGLRNIAAVLNQQAK